MRIAKLLLILLSLNFANADSLCTGTFVNPITGICWDCLFPMSFGNVALVPSSFPDTGNPSDPICICQMPIGYRIGIAFGYWEPEALADVTRDPFCMVNLGISINMGMLNNDIGSEQGNDGAAGRGAFFWVHWYYYPLMSWLNILTDVTCMETGDFDIAYMTELDPTWQDDQLAFLLNPEAILFGNPIAQEACAADATTTLAGNELPIDSLFWCLGSQGSAYPLTGNISDQVTDIQAATQEAERMNFKLHREGLLWDTTGDNVCSEVPTPILPKSRYRYQMTNTIPDASTCYPYGSGTVTWEVGHDNLSDEENYGYLMWRKRNCCML